MGTRVPPFLGLLRCSPNPVPTVLVVPKNCCQAFIFNYWKFASGPKTLEKMLSGVQFSMNEMLPVVPKKATNCWRGFICCGWNFEHSTVFGTAAAPRAGVGTRLGGKSKHRQNKRDKRHQVREIQTEPQPRSKWWESETEPKPTSEWWKEDKGATREQGQRAKHRSDDALAEQRSTSRRGETMKRTEKSRANSRQKGTVNSRQKSIVNSMQKSKANSRQDKSSTLYRKSCSNPSSQPTSHEASKSRC